jgi:predicted Zn finger-like uncharacterized protein
MRLTCPTCSARYEIEPALIAPGGQHVQCTACHSRWFVSQQAAPARAAPESEDAILDRLDKRTKRLRVVPATGGAPGAADAPAPDSEPRGFTWERRSADPRAPLNVVAGERTEGSAKDPVPTERAPEPLPQAASSVADEPEHEPMLEEPPFEPAAAEAAAPGSIARPRLDLEGAASASALQRPLPPPLRRRFGRGVLFGLLVAGLLYASYRAADEIAVQVPATGPYLTRYVAAVDEGRLWMEATFGPSVERLRDAVAGAG